MGTTITIESTVDYRWLMNRTKDRLKNMIYGLRMDMGEDPMRIKVEDATKDALASQIVRLMRQVADKQAIETLAALPPHYQGLLRSYKHPYQTVRCPREFVRLGLVEAHTDKSRVVTDSDWVEAFWTLTELGRDVVRLIENSNTPSLSPSPQPSGTANPVAAEGPTEAATGPLSEPKEGR